MIYFTACFGSHYKQALKGMVRSFLENTDHNLLVFSDMNHELDPKRVTVERQQLGSLWKTYGHAFYKSGSRVNVFKIALFKQLAEKYPEESFCWIDTDMLVLDEIHPHLREDKITVVEHGNRVEPVDAGNGYTIPAGSFAIGGLYVLPARFTEQYHRIALERPKWKKRGRHMRGSGDMVLLNHLVHMNPEEVHWVNQERHILNLSSSTTHPRVGDKKLAKIHLEDGKLYQGERQIVVFVWTKLRLAEQLKNNFQTFKPKVRELISRYYA